MTQISQTIMKTETCLEIQAYVDGELDASRRAVVERLCATDSEARQLSDGLKALRSAVRANEPEIHVPESREFYWSQIQRRMSAASATAPTTDTGAAWTQWMRWLVPMAGAAGGMLIAGLATGIWRSPLYSLIFMVFSTAKGEGLRSASVVSSICPENCASGLRG